MNCQNRRTNIIIYFFLCVLFLTLRQNYVTMFICVPCAHYLYYHLGLFLHATKYDSLLASLKDEFAIFQSLQMLLLAIYNLI